MALRLVGRRHLLTRSRVDAELQHVTKKKRLRKADAAPTELDSDLDLDDLYQRFDLVRTG